MKDSLLKYKFIIVCLLLSFSSCAQFSKFFHDVIDSSRIEDAFLYEKDIYLTKSYRCPVANDICIKICKVNGEGKLVWEKKIDSFRIGTTNSILIYDNEIYISGNHHFPKSATFNLVKLDLDGNLIDEKEIPIVSGLDFSLNYGITLGRGSIWLYGVVSNTDTTYNGIILQLGPDLSFVDSLEIDLGNKVNNIFDLQENENGEMIFMGWGDQTAEGIQRIIIGLNEFNVPYEIFTSEYLTVTGFIDNFLALEANTYAFVSPNGQEIFSRVHPLIKIISEQGDLLSATEVFLNFNDATSVAQITATAEGGILGCGKYTHETSNGFVSLSALIFKISKDGDLEWFRTYPVKIENSEQFGSGLFIDVFEDQDGSIIATGSLSRRNGDVDRYETWIVKLNKNGCFHNSECGLESDPLTSNKASDLLSIRDFYPNPFEHEICMKGLSEYFEARIYDIHSNLVKIIKKEDLFSNCVDLNDIGTGIYLVQLEDDIGNISLKPIFKIQ